MLLLLDVHRSFPRNFYLLFPFCPSNYTTSVSRFNPAHPETGTRQHARTAAPTTQINPAAGKQILLQQQEKCFFSLFCEKHAKKQEDLCLHINIMIIIINYDDIFHGFYISGEEGGAGWCHPPARTGNTPQRHAVGGSFLEKNICTTINYNCCNMQIYICIKMDS
jgi:hypothetical protein